MRSICQSMLRRIFSVRPAMMLSSAVMPLKQRDVLEGARDAAGGGIVRAHLARASPLKVMTPCCG